MWASWQQKVHSRGGWTFCFSFCHLMHGGYTCRANRKALLANCKCRWTWNVTSQTEVTLGSVSAVWCIGGTLSMSIVKHLLLFVKADDHEALLAELKWYWSLRMLIFEGKSNKNEVSMTISFTNNFQMVFFFICDSDIFLLQSILVKSILWISCIVCIGICRNAGWSAKRAKDRMWKVWVFSVPKQHKCEKNTLQFVMSDWHTSLGVLVQSEEIKLWLSFSCLIKLLWNQRK